MHALSLASCFSSTLRVASPLRFFLGSLRSIYQKHDSLEKLFSAGDNIGEGITNFRTHFFGEIDKSRTFKHVSDPSNGSAAKRLCMFTRWMVRSSNRNVDFGLWKSIPTSTLMCPLDVHSGNVARALGILHRKQNDWKAVVELTEALKTKAAARRLRKRARHTKCVVAL